MSLVDKMQQSIDNLRKQLMPNSAGRPTASGAYNGQFEKRQEEGEYDDRDIQGTTEGSRSSL